ncbi:MAG: LysR family transcriptional regulator [Chloroflexota bacterium]|nr:LysR family transcriptional regulator [Chloroflexota bacterium]
MELGQLEAFTEVVRARSFSKAARAMGLTQPSLSARIISIEKELGETLFHRMGRGVRLTESGRALLPYVERALDSLRNGREALEASRNAAVGRLRIGAARAVSAYVLPGIVQAFRERYPGVEVAIKTGRSSQVFEMVLREEIQVGVSRAFHHPEVATKHLYDEQVVLVTHPEHPFAKAGEASIYEVGREPLIVYDKESTYFQLIDRVCREAGILPSITMDLDSIEATKRMIERGLGLSFLPLNALRRELAQGILARVELREGHRVTLPTAAMVRRDGAYGAILTAFLDLLDELYPQPEETAPDSGAYPLNRLSSDEATHSAPRSK